MISQLQLLSLFRIRFRGVTFGSLMLSVRVIVGKVHLDVQLLGGGTQETRHRLGVQELSCLRLGGLAGTRQNHLVEQLLARMELVPRGVQLRDSLLNASDLVLNLIVVRAPALLYLCSTKALNIGSILRTCSLRQMSGNDLAALSVTLPSQLQARYHALHLLSLLAQEILIAHGADQRIQFLLSVLQLPLWTSTTNHGWFVAPTCHELRRSGTVPLRGLSLHAQGHEGDRKKLAWIDLPSAVVVEKLEDIANGIQASQLLPVDAEVRQAALKLKD
mmetsp:Transcript_39193/g.92266  ORF Transcript_39193/g.92266 Transcript_39193/m.92266 type:complete len:275 (-) Transcript_39193:1369-2193(-)